MINSAILAVVLCIALLKVAVAQAPGGALLLSPPPLTPAPMGGLITFSPNPLSTADNTVTSGQKVAIITLASSISNDTLTGTCREQSPCPWTICGATGNWGVCAAATLNSSYDVTNDHYDVTASPPQTVGCVYGNHGAVRGRPQIAHGTILAEDGCLLRGFDAAGVGNGSASCFNAPDLAFFQNSVNAGHFNAVSIGAAIECPVSYGQAAMTQAQADAFNDASLANVSQTGQYLVLSFYNWVGGNSQCADWSDNVPYWSHTAARYANNTNVIFTIQNEPDWQPSCTPTLTNQQIANNEQAVYNAIRAAAPNSPILIWSWSNIGSIYDDPANLNNLLPAPGVSYSNAVFDFHAYNCCGYLQTVINNATAEHVPLSSSENPFDSNTLTSLDSAGVAWFSNGAMPESGITPGLTVFWQKD